jgi:hypothetical protein
MPSHPIARASLAAVLTLAAAPLAAQSFELEPRVGYPDFGFMEPPGAHDGPVFVLSDAYPRELPPLDPEVEEILTIDFRAEPLRYVMAVRDYIFRGNIHGGPVSEDFVLQANSAGRDWYHVPWQHWGPTGREGWHGLTREGPLAPQVLAPSQTEASYAYAVGFYNGPGGFAIGQVFPAAGEGPDLTRFIEGEGFPEGTVVGKFLFTVLGADQVPWLANPLQWRAYIYNCDIPAIGGCPDTMTGAEGRSTQRVNLLQMDVMVKDSRAEEAAGWVFGTFAYNGLLPEGHVYSRACAGIEGPGRNWCNLTPVGVMWGNDPENAESFVNAKPTATRINPTLEQTWINPDPALPAMHLGFNSRLNGPADNPASSCMSCHATGQVPSVSPIMPFLAKPPIPIPANGTEAPKPWMRWFRNFRDGEAFDAGRAVTMDFSMQLTKAVENYMDYLQETQKGGFALQYWSMDGDGTPVARGARAPSN